MVFTKTEPNIMPRQQAAAAPVAPTPQMEMPQARPVIAAPQPQQQPTVQPDVVPQPAAPQQPAVQAPQMQMPTGQLTPKEQAQQDRAAMVAAMQQQEAARRQAEVAQQQPQPTAQEQAQQAYEQAASEQQAQENSFWQKYGGVNWGANNGDFFANAAEANIPIHDAIRYYDAFQKDTGGEELNPWDVYARYGDKDFSKSIKQQEEEDRKLALQHKWEKIGDAFTSLANLWGTMRGAPNIPLESGEALTKRQQEQVDRVRTLRQAAGKRYIDALQQKKAEEFKRKQLENEAARLAENQRYHDVLAGLSAKKEENNVLYKGKAADLAERKQTHTEEKDKKQLDIAQQNADSRKQSANASMISAKKKENKGGGSRGGSGSNLIEKTTTVKKDPRGRETTTVRTKEKVPAKKGKGNVNSRLSWGKK